MTVVTLTVEKEEDLTLLKALAKKMGIRMSVQSPEMQKRRSKKVLKVIEAGAELADLDGMLKHIREGRSDRNIT
jgi:hypothetical protein